MSETVKLGVATMTDKDMEARSAAIKAAQEAEKLAAEAAAAHAKELAERGLSAEVPEGMVRVAVSTARPHYRAGRYWPASTPEARSTIADVDSMQLERLRDDHELSVAIVSAPAAPAAEKPKGKKD